MVGLDRSSITKTFYWSTAILLFPNLVPLLYPDISGYYLPTVQSLFIGVGCAILLAFIRSDANRFIASLWLIWFFIGNLNAISSYMTLGPFYRPYLDEPATIYFVFTFVFFLGLIATEVLTKKLVVSPAKISNSIGIVLPVLLAIFCVFWGMLLVAYAGYVPILSGFDITDSIYETNYGPLYGYGIVLVWAAIALLYRASEVRGAPGRILGVLALVSVTAISLLDGKRYLAILILLAACFYVTKMYGSKRARSILLTMMAVAIATYVSIFIVRQGLNTERYGDGWLSVTSIAGVEYRDFAYTVSRWEPGSIPSYNWHVSAFASMLNQNLLDLLGYDKPSLVNEGSAFAWSRIFNSPYGIRTGIVSELWFAYGWFGLPIIASIGLVVSLLSITLEKSSNAFAIVNLTVVLALLASMIMGQMTSISGSITVLVYLNIVLSCWSLLSSGKVRPGTRSILSKKGAL